MIFKTITDELGNTKLSVNSGLKSLFSGDLFKQQSIISTDDIRALQAYNAEIEHGVSPMTAYYRTMQNASDTAVRMAESANGATVELSQIPKISKAGEVALKGLSIAGNMLAMWAITKVLQTVTEKIHELANASKIASEKSEGFANSVKNSISNLSSNASTLSDLNEEYQKLSQGVNNLGQNVSLSSDDYDRYKQIIHQVSDIMPNLTTYFNAQGEAIAFANGKLSNLNEGYERYIQAQAKAYLVNGDEDGNTIQDVLDNYANNSQLGFWESIKNTVKNMFGSYDIDDMEVNTMIQAFKDIQNKSREEIVEYLNDIDLGANGEYLNTDNNRSKAIIQSILGYSTQDILKSGDDEFKEIQTIITNHIEQLQASLDTDMSHIHISLLNSVYAKDAFWNIDDASIRDDITTFMLSLNNDVWDQINDGTETNLQLFVSNIINGFSENKDGFADSWNGLFDPELLELPASEYEAKIQEFINTIADYIGLDENGKKEFLISLGIKADGIRRLHNQIGDLTRKDPTHMAQLIQYTENFTEAQIEAWLTATNGINSVEAAIRAYEATLESFDDDTPDSFSISHLIDQLNTQLKPAYDSLKSAYQSIFTDDGFSPDAVDISMLENIKSEIEELNNMEDVDININIEDFDEFAKILTDINTTEEQAQQAFDDLSTAIFNATGATEGMTDETVKLVEQLLESLGVANAAEVAEQALKESKVQAVMATYDLIDATENEYIAMINEAEATGIARQEVYRLMAAEIAFGNNGLSVEQKIDQLHNLASAYGDTATAALAGAIADEYASGHTDVDTAINDIMAKINAGVQRVDIDFSGMKKSAGSAGSSAGKEAGESFTDALDKELAALDKKMETGYIDFNDYIHERLDLIEDYYRKGKISADKYYSYLEKHYNTQLSYMDKVVNAVTRRIDKEIDSLEKQKDEIEEYYQVQIDSLENEKNLLEEANKERERQLDLQKALYEMERAHDQRTILQYSAEKGMHYVADDKAIRDAEDDVNDAKYKIHISEIEKSISKLEEVRDRQTDAIDAQIAKLEEYKDAWKDIASAYEEQQEDLLAAQVLGQNWEADILSGRLDTLNSFKAQYIVLQQSIADAALQSTQAEANAIQPVSDAIGQAAGGMDRLSSSAAAAKANIDDVTASLSNAAGEKERLGDTSDEEIRMNALKDAVDEVGKSIDKNTEAYDIGKQAVDTLVDDEINRLATLSDSLTTISDAVMNIVSDSVASLGNADSDIDHLSGVFADLGDAILGVSDALGVGSEGTVGGLVGALQQINTLSLGGEGPSGGGIISQFDALRQAVKNVTSAIGGGGDTGGGSGDDGPSGGDPGSESAGGSNSLIGAMNAFKAATDTALGGGSGEAPGEEASEGTGAIPQFAQLKSAVDNVSAAVGSKNSEEADENLINSIISMGNTTSETLGEPDGEGAIGQFEEFGNVIGDAENHVKGISNGLDQINGRQVECTIRINVESNGSIPAGFGLAEGTALASGNWAVQSDEKHALVGELGRELIVRNGRFFTVGNIGAEFVDIKKGDIVFNHAQTEELLKNGHISGRGKAYADGMVGDKLASGVLRSLQPGDEMYDYIQKFSAYLEKMGGDISSIPGSVNAIQRDMEQAVQAFNTISNMNNSNNRTQQVNIGDIHVTCPGVTSQEV